jgi:hypothetical protein
MFSNKVLRNILGTMKADVGNLCTSITRSLLNDIKTEHFQWYGHVIRMEEGRLLKEVMKWRPPGRRK